ncbi:winged helix-turn-helix transcriptional regulator [Pseudomonas sp. R1-15]
MSVNPPTEPTANGSMLDRCIRLSRAYTSAARRVDAKLSAVHGLSFSDFMILYHLKHAHNSRLRRADLADCMGLTASAVTKSLLSLEKIGLVSRQSDPRDARVGYACLTTTGEQVVADAQVSAEFACQEVYEAMVGEWNKAG